MGALEKLESLAVGRIRLPHLGIRQDEFLEFGAVKRGFRLCPRVGKSFRLRIDTAIESRKRDGIVARLEASAAHLRE